WTAMALPLLSPIAAYHFTAISARAANDVWAVGAYYQRDIHTPLLAHWDGTAWHLADRPARVPYASNLVGIAAVNATTVWAVGSFGGSLIMRWDGTAWGPVASPNVLRNGNRLTAVAALAPNDVWALGMSGSGIVALHWDGSRWSVRPAPGR